MFRALIKRCVFWQTKEPAASSYGGIHGHLLDLEDADIPRYPPFAKGLPATPIDKLLSTQRQLIARIHQSLGFSREDADRLLFPVIRNYAAFVHLLPASEAHHHRGAGGLFRHGLEVAFWATQASEAIIFEPEGSPEEKIEKEPRWRFGVFLGALMHDLGKPLSDVVVTDKPGKLEWNPYAETLEEWLNETNITHYFLRWNKGRHQRHERLATLALNKVMTGDVMRYLRLPGPELMKTLIEAISGTSALHPMSKLIMLADSESVKRDLKENRLSVDGNSLGVSIEPYIIDAIRSLVHSGRWKTNQMDAQVWHLTQGTFIAWRQAVPSLVQKLKDNSVPAVPHDPDTLADYLIDRGFALPRPIPGREDEADEHYYRYWEVTVEVEAEEGLTVEPTILMLRMEDSFLVFGNANNPPDTLEATIPGLDVDGQLLAGKESIDSSEAANTQSSEADVEITASSDSDGEQPPNSVRERLLSFQSTKGTESDNVLAALDALSAGAFGGDEQVGAHDSNKRNTDNTAITDKTDIGKPAIAVGDLGSVAQLTGSSASMSGADALALLKPAAKGKRATGNPAPRSKKINRENDVLGDMLVGNQGMHPPKSSVVGGPQESNAPDALDFGSLCGMFDTGLPSGSEIEPNKEAGLSQAPVAKRSKAVGPKSAISTTVLQEKPSDEVVAYEADADDVDSVIAAFAELSHAMGADMGMDLPFDLPEAKSSRTDHADDDDDDIQYESIDCEAVTSEHPVAVENSGESALVAESLINAGGYTASDTTPISTPTVEVTSKAEPSKVVKERPRPKPRSRGTQNAQPEISTADMFAPIDTASDAKINAPAAMAVARVSNDLIASLTGKQTAQTQSIKPTTSPTVSVASDDIAALLGAGANKHSRLSTGKPSNKVTSSPQASPAPLLTDKAIDLITPIVESTKDESVVDQMPHADQASVGDNAVIDIGMPSFEILRDAEQKGGVTQVEQVESPSAAPLDSNLSSEPYDGDRPPLDCYDDMPSFDIDDEPDETFSYQDNTDISGNSNAAPLNNVIAGSPTTIAQKVIGEPSAKQLANQYLSDVLAPILNGYGLLGQVLLRQPPEQLVLRVDAACQLLGKERSELIPALVEGGAVLDKNVPLNIEQLTLDAETSCWVEGLLREREEDRMNDMAMAVESTNDNRRADEKPTTSLVRRKARTSPKAAVVPLQSLDSTSLIDGTAPSSRPDSTSILDCDTDPLESSKDEDSDLLTIPTKKSMSAHDALTRLRAMIIAGEGEWLVGSVSKESEGFSTSDMCLEKVAKDNSALSRTMLRNALRISQELKMSVVAKNNRIYVKE